MRQTRYRQMDSKLGRDAADGVMDVLAMLDWLDRKLQPVMFIPAMAALARFLRRRAMRLRAVSRALDEMLRPVAGGTSAKA